MIITPATLNLLFQAYNIAFSDAFKAAPAQWSKVAMKAMSGTSEEIYPWLGQFPQMREWVGDRVIKSLQAHAFTIKNRKFESTVDVPRDMISDDRYGVFKSAFEHMGRTAALHPDSLLFPLLKTGFTTNCYDGQFFFDTDHPVLDENDQETSVSNMQAGAGPAWFLLDTTQAVKPLIWQVREDYEFQTLTDPANERVFLRDEYLYGVRARVNAGFGLWQTAFGSKAPLTAQNYAAARAAMQVLRGDRGQILGITPNMLVVPPQLEEAARLVLSTSLIGGGTNVWKDTADIVVSPFLA